LWLLAFSPRPLRIQAPARDAEQADEVRLIVRQILAINAPANKALAKSIDVQRSLIVGPGGECHILTADKFGSHGARYDPRYRPLWEERSLPDSAWARHGPTCMMPSGPAFWRW
jgi:hypothetical protein